MIGVEEHMISLNGENEAAMLLTVAGINVGKSVNNVQGALGVLLLWSSEPSEYFDLLTVALELSHRQLSLFVLLVLSLAHVVVCLQQLSYLLAL